MSVPLTLATLSLTGKARRVNAIIELIRWGAFTGPSSASSSFTPFQLISSSNKPFPSRILHRAPGIQSDMFRTGVTEIHTIASADHGSVRYLMQHGELKKHLRSKDSYGETPLHYAARGGKAEIVDALLSLGGNVECVDNWGFTPLHCACEGEIRSRQDIYMSLMHSILTHNCAWNIARFAFNSV